MKRFTAKCDETVTVALHLAMANACFLGVMELVGYVVVAAVITFGTWEILNARLTTVTLTTYILFAGFLIHALGALANHVGLELSYRSLLAQLATLAAGLGASERVLALLDKAHEHIDVVVDNHVHPSASQDIQHGTVQGHLQFDDVTLWYNEEGQGQRPSLSHLTLDVPAGSTLYIVGNSGSGKSTILQLLLKLYTAQEVGALLICACSQF